MTLRCLLANLLLVGLLLMTGADTGFAQNGPIQFRRLTIEQGLSQNSVNSILQDRRGFMWFGTNDGLNRFDGYAFKIYRNDPNNPNSLSSNFVHKIFQDRNAIMWLATTGGGLVRFDPITEQFHSFRPPSGMVLDFVETPEHRFLCGTNLGVFEFDPATSRFQSLAERWGLPFLKEYCNRLCLDRAGYLWVRVNTGLLALNQAHQIVYDLTQDRPAVADAFRRIHHLHFRRS